MIRAMRVTGRALLLSAAIGVVLAPSPATADDVKEQVEEAMKAYARGDTSTAIAGLEAAVNLLRQGRADRYGKLLPEVPTGWKGDDVETTSMGAALMGGGVGASRKYHRGESTVTVSILADSPFLQMVNALASSGMANMAGARTQIVNRRRTLYMKDDNAFMAVIADRVVVRVEGVQGVPEATLKDFLTAIDFDAIERATK